MPHFYQVKIYLKLDIFINFYLDEKELLQVGELIIRGLRMKLKKDFVSNLQTSIDYIQLNVQTRPSDKMNYLLLIWWLNEIITG
jgi:hypothetical protein